MAASSLSTFFSYLLPSKSPIPSPPLPPPSPPSHLHLPKKPTSGWTQLAATWGPTTSSTLDYITPIFCPALAYSNTLFFKSAYNVQVIVGEDEPEEKLVGRFRRDVLRAGVIQECKRRRFFENKHDKIKRKAREAARRNRKRRPPPRSLLQAKQEDPNKKKDDDKDDNWEDYEVDLPYR